MVSDILQPGEEAENLPLAVYLEQSTCSAARAKLGLEAGDELYPFHLTEPIESCKVRSSVS